MDDFRSPPSPDPSLREGNLRLRFGGRSYLVERDRAFVLAHALFQKKECAAAAQVLEALTRAGDAHPRTAVLLACCKAATNDFAASHDLLEEAFPGEDQPVATRLHEAFIFHRVGMTRDTVQELTLVANQRRDLAVVCLLLGDVFAAVGRRRKAAVCWTLAVQRDAEHGPVTQAARAELKKLKTAKKNNP